MKHIQSLFTVLNLTIILAVFLTSSCKKSNTSDFVNNLPEIPLELLASLDSVKMISRIPDVAKVATKQPLSAIEPCCSMSISRTLKVSFPFTKCGPLSDFLPSAPDDMVVLDTENETGKKSVLYNYQNRKVELHKMKNARPKTASKEFTICMTSNGPWNAELREDDPCSGSSSYLLITTAFDEIVTYGWLGSIDGHPQGIDLVDCRLNNRSGSICGISTCVCPFFSCPANETCACDINESW